MNSNRPDSVPLLDLRRQYVGIRDEILRAVTRVCDSQTFVLGPEVEALEQEVAALTGADFAVGCSSGTEALWLALVAAGVRPGDAVITSPFSFFASASAIVRAGATPIFADIDPDTLNVAPAQVDQILSYQTPSRRPSPSIRAILPVHLYGQCANMDALHQVASNRQQPDSADGRPADGRLAEDQSPTSRIAVVEDAAQAIGAAYKGRPAGSLGVAAAFSFYPTKNLSAYGDAGIVTTSDQEMAGHMRRLRNHGSPKRYYHDEFGWNGRMDAIQAAILRVKLPHIAAWNESRRRHAATYDRLFAESGLVSPPDPVTDSAGQPSVRQRSVRSLGGEMARAPIRVLARDPQAEHVFHQYVIRAERRDELRQFLAEKKIGSEVYYPLPLHLQNAFAYLGHKPGDFPVAEQAAREVLALPMFPELMDVEIERVVESVADFYKRFT